MHTKLSVSLTLQYSSFGLSLSCSNIYFFLRVFDFTPLFLHHPNHTRPLQYLLVPVHQLSFQIPESSPPRQTCSFLGKSYLNTSSDPQWKQHLMAKKIHLQLILQFLQKVLSTCQAHHTSGQPEVDRQSRLF